MARNQWNNARHLTSGAPFEDHGRWWNATALDDLPLSHVSELLPNAHGGVTIVGDRCTRLIHLGPGGGSFAARPLHFVTTPLTVRPDGSRVYVTLTDDRPRRSVIWPVPTEHDHNAIALAVRHADHRRLSTFLTPLAVIEGEASTLTSTLSGDLLLGTTNPAGLHAISSGGAVAHLVGAEVAPRPDPGPDRVTAIAPLPDGRITFTHATRDAFRLFVYADQAVHRIRPVGDNPLRPHPRDLGDRPSDRRLRREVHHLSPITPAPGGQLVTVGFTRDQTPQISLLDISSGEARTLARLNGVRPRIGAGVFEPSRVVSVAPWNGTDLLVLADGQLWNLPSVFPSSGIPTRRSLRPRRRSHPTQTPSRSEI